MCWMETAWNIKCLIAAFSKSKYVCQTFSMGSFPDGCMKGIQQIWELFHLACQVFAAQQWLQHLIRSNLKPYMHGLVSSLGAFVLVSVMLLFHLFSPLGCMKWIESENQWWPAALLPCSHIWEVNRTKTQRTVNEPYPIQHGEWMNGNNHVREVKVLQHVLCLSKYETILASSRISRRFYCSAVSGFNV